LVGYTEDQLVEQPAIGLFAERSALPNPQPGLSATLLTLGEGPGDAGAQLTLPPEAITAAISENCPVSPAGEMACSSGIPVQITGHESGHKTRQESGVIAASGLCSSLNPDNKPDIYADI
jgi:hypothetical protein